MRKKDKILTTDSQIDKFISLVQVMLKDENIKKLINKLSNLECNKRIEVINKMVIDMKIKNAPADFITSISYLKDENINKKIKEMILTQEI